MVFADVPFTEIIPFLREYRAHPAHEQFSDTRLADYIARQNEAEPGSLAKWNVGVIGAANGEKADHPLGTLGMFPP